MLFGFCFLFAGFLHPSSIFLVGRWAFCPDQLRDTVGGGSLGPTLIGRKRRKATRQHPAMKRRATEDVTDRSLTKKAKAFCPGRTETLRVFFLLMGAQVPQIKSKRKRVYKVQATTKASKTAAPPGIIFNYNLPASVRAFCPEFFVDLKQCELTGFFAVLWQRKITKGHLNRIEVLTGLLAQGGLLFKWLYPGVIQTEQRVEENR